MSPQNKKRIAFLKSSILNRGGLEKYTRRLAARCAEMGHEVFLLTTDCEGPLEKGVETVNFGRRLKISSAHLLWFDYQCKKYIKNNPVDVIFGMDRNFCRQTHYRAGNGVHAAYLARRKQRASLWKKASFFINPLHQIILQMEKKTFESPELQRLFTNSHMVAQEIREYYPKVDPQKIVVVHNGVEWKALEKPFHEGLLQRPSGPFHFLFIGNEYERKGLPLLLQALTLLKTQDYQLTIVGKERRMSTFQKMASRLGLEAKVRFCGAVTDTKPYFSAADCVVIPSLYDPFANVTVEALAFGVPVISSSQNGGSEILTRPELGWVFHDLDDPSELAHCLEEAMQRPKTPTSAHTVRSLVAPYDYSNQIDLIACHL